MDSKKSVSILLLLLIGIANCVPGDEDLIAEESSHVVLQNEASQEIKKQTNNSSQIRANKYSSRIESKYSPVTETQYGLRTYPITKSNSFKNLVSAKNGSVLDFRIGHNEVDRDKKDIRTAGSENGKEGKETKKEDDDEEKMLSQQVADGKYGLIQNELFANGSKRPGILSYLPNKEVPKDTKENLGGLDKDEIWLAEDHVLVLKGGRYPEDKENETPGASVWPPIDDYEAPLRQVKIPANPKIPPPFPIQLSDNGPLEIIKGENGAPPQFPYPQPFPPFPFNDSLPFPPPFPIPDGFPNKSFPFPPPPGSVPPFLNNFPPGAAFLPPPGNLTDFDEDDPSIYYPPKYDFYYPEDNTTVVPPGPLVPGIILPPPPNFFAALKNKTEEPQDKENETEDSQPFVGPGYLPARKPARTFKRPLKRPTTPISINEISDHTSPKPEVTTIQYVYPVNSKRKPATVLPFDSLRTTKVVSKIPEENTIDGFTSPIYVPSGNEKPYYHPLPTTSPKPNHITIPTSKTLTKEIYIVAKPEYDKNNFKDIYKDPKFVSADKYENLRPEVHPLRSLIKPNVSVSYVGKYGHLPGATPFPFPKRLTEEEKKLIRGGHFITQTPDIKENVITSPAPEVNSISVTPIPVVKEIRLPTSAKFPPAKPSKATIFIYDAPKTDNLRDTVKTTEASKDVSSEKPLAFADDVKNEIHPPVQYPSSLTTSRTPIRQFLEETFHASNVLQNKPAISHLAGSNIPNQAYSPDIPKIKHLNYGTPVFQKPVIKYKYVTEPAVVKIKTLEVENSGQSGHQSIQPENSVSTTTASPFGVYTTVYKPEKQNLVTISHTTTTPRPIEYTNTDGPFVPSNYYATVKPDDIHFTPHDHSLVDDITKNYFTIFGQKINSVSTTPLVPVKATSAPNVGKPSGLSYVSDNGNNYQVQQIHTTRKPPSQNSLAYYNNENPKFVQVVTPAPRPQSHFDQYLKELTGEDQKDFIVLPHKTKKGKGFAAPGQVYSTIQQQIQLQPQLHHAPTPIYLHPYRQSGLSQFLEDQTQAPPLKQVYTPPKYPVRYVNRPKIQYRPGYSTTLRPVMDVEIQPQYVQHVSSTARPFQVVPQNIRINHNFGQYLQEITSFTSPTTVSPVKIKNPASNLEYYQTTPLPNQIRYSQGQYPAPETNPKPISLEGDILVNYKPQRPEVNPDAEIVDVQNPINPLQTFDGNSNFKIVAPPDLGGRKRPPYRSSYKARPPTYDAAKDFFQNLPNSGYFSPPQPSGNSFISYNLPGNGGHFYFLTPQVADKSAEEDEDERPKRDKDRLNKQRYGLDARYPSEIEPHSGNDYTNQDYLRRRRRKKP